MADPRSQIQNILFDGLISAYKYQKSPIVMKWKKIHPKAFLIDHQTVRLSLPRRLGNTRLAIMLMNFFPEASYLTWNKEMLNSVKKPLEGRDCFTYRQSPEGMKFKILVVDIPIQFQTNRIFEFKSDFYFILG